MAGDERGLYDDAAAGDGFSRRHQCVQHRRSISVWPGADGQSGHEIKRDARARSICRRARAGLISGRAKHYSGGQTIEAAAPIETVPLFVRAGSIIPYGPAIEYAAETERPRLNCAFIAARTEASRSTKTKATITITKRAHMRQFRLRGRKQSKTLTIGKRTGKFPGMLKQRTFRIVWVADHHGVGVATTPTPDATLTYDGSAVQISGPKP